MQPTYYLAPLRGVTDYIFRTAFERNFGQFDFLLTPFITTVKGREVTPAHLRDISGPGNDRQRVVPQILGNDPDDILLLADHVRRLGYQTVNWNLGCPHQPVTKKRRGSGLLPHPELVASVLDKVLYRFDGAFSVKVRLGLNSGDDLENLIPVLNSYPLKEIIIHPRTGRQGYAGSVDLDRFASAATVCTGEVVYNGDISSLEGFEALQRRFPEVNRWMVGRGVAHNPLLLRSLRDGRKCRAEPEAMRRFHDEVFEENRRMLFGPSHLLGKMKEFWWYFSANFNRGQKILRAIQRTVSVDRYLQLVDEAFQNSGTR